MTRPRPAAVLLLTGVAGACTMVVELSAVRLLAPWFGTSTAVWTNVIGIVLLALSVGYLLGARLSERPEPARRLGSVLAAGGLFTLVLPTLAAPVCALFVPEGLALDQSVALFTWGSLAAGLLLFAPAAIALGCVGPLATEALQRGGEQHAGAAGGRVLCVGTLGSLAGTFATTHTLIPELGLRGTFLLAGAVLCALAAWTLLVSRRVAALSATLFLGGLLGAFSRFEAPTSKDARVLASAESGLQSLRVVEVGEGAELRRLLQANEGLDSYQSLWQEEPGIFAEGTYYNGFALPLYWNNEAPVEIFVAGFGAGTVFRVLSKYRTFHMTGVEIDPVVLELGHEWLDLPREDPRLTLLSGWDGRAALRTLEKPQQLVILDAYANQTEIPAHLSSVEFFREVAERLAPRGMLAVNVGGFGFDDPVVSAVASTIAEAFEQRVLAIQVPRARNVLLYCGRDAESPDPSSPEWVFAGEVGEALAKPTALPGMSRWFERGGPVLTDDRNPIDRLQEASLARGLDGWLKP